MFPGLGMLRGWGIKAMTHTCLIFYCYGAPSPGGESSICTLLYHLERISNILLTGGGLDVLKKALLARERQSGSSCPLRPLQLPVGKVAAEVHVVKMICWAAD